MCARSTPSSFQSSRMLACVISLAIGVIACSHNDTGDHPSDSGGEPADVTFEEYEQGAIAAIECIRAEGLQATGPDLQPNGELTLTVAYPAGTAEAVTREGNAIAERCMAEHWDEVAEAYNEVLAARRAITQESRLAALRECLRNLGFEVADDANWYDISGLADESDEALGCFFEYSDG